MLGKLGHEALAEAHDLPVGFALGIKIAAALTAADGQAGQAVLEDLLEAQEFDDGGVDGGMETQTALVGTDGRVELNAVTAVHLHVAVVIHPGNAEHDGTFGLNQTLQDAPLFDGRILCHHGLQGFQYFFDGLKEFLLSAVTLFYLRVNLGKIRALKAHNVSP